MSLKISKMMISIVGVALLVVMAVLYFADYEYKASETSRLLSFQARSGSCSCGPRKHEEER